MAYAFEGVDIAKPEGYSLLHFKEVFTSWDSAFAVKGWLSVFLANHDQARLVSRFGNDSPEFRDPSSKMLTTFILTMRGTPYYFNGDELGMTNPQFNKITDYRDMSTINEYLHQKNNQGDTLQFLKQAKFESRDNGRTPFQWDSSKNAGFTTGSPWIAVNPNYIEVNVSKEENEPNSCLNYFRKLVKIRKNNLVLVYGKYRLLDKDNRDIYAYTREGEGKKMLVLLNFTAHNARANLEIPTAGANMILSNYDSTTASSHRKQLSVLRPYEAIIYQLP
jgi:oligo-1,6-glucosidase